MQRLIHYGTLLTMGIAILALILWFFGTLLPNAMVKVGRDEANQMKSEQINRGVK